MTLAKGITNAAVPMGAVAADARIYEAVVNSVPAGIELFHGYTYSGHPLACAAGLATLDVYRDEGLFARAAELAPYWEDAVHSLRSARHVVDVRSIGLVGAVELAPRKDAPGARAAEVFKRCFDDGLLTRYTGETIALSPPLIIEKAQIDEVVEKLGRAIDATA
jgi:beta-alanine--pyruvate transaminase